MKDVANTYMI